MQGVEDALAAAFANIELDQGVVVAFSGGIDSTVLLHACHHYALTSGHTIKALYVDHQLQKHSSDWQRHCQKFCAALEINYDSVQVDTRAFADNGPEGSAREARYQAFSEYLHAGEVLLTAHHADDQVETLFLRLLRGAGNKGLVGCVAQRQLGSGQLLRPLLGVSQQIILCYAEGHHLEWCDDPSNQSLQMDRNYLRHEVMPKLYQRWPQLRATVLRASQWQAESTQLLERLAEQDCGGCSDNPLPIEVLPKQHAASLKNALRWWIQQQGFKPPSASVLQQITEHLLPAPEDAMACVKWSQVEMRKYRDQLYVFPALSEHCVSQQLAWDLNDPLHLPSVGVTLTHNELHKAGLSLQGVEQLHIRFRQGGESLRPRGRGCEKSLKALFQEQGVPPWLRDRIPLLYHHDQLIFVLGYWIHEGY
jgi:tRNA(Ile)-lysidine synthase